ncbi:unnamed protein product, partial [Effrenium voratum]
RGRGALLEQGQRRARDPRGGPGAVHQRHLGRSQGDARRLCLGGDKKGQFVLQLKAIGA